MTLSDTEAATASLVQWFSGFFDDIENMSRDAAVILAAVDHPSHPELPRASSTQGAIDALSRDFLATHAYVDGAGLIVPRSAVTVGESAITWWVRNDDGSSSHYSFAADPTSSRFYDFERLEWFTNAFVNRSRSIVGPYIDYLGVEEYVVTLTAPVVGNDGQVMGVVGADIRMHDLETDLLPVMRRLPPDSALVNKHGSVLMGNSGRFIPGDRVSTAADAPGVRRLVIPGIELRLLIP